MRAILYYLYSDYIVFAPITNSRSKIGALVRHYLQQNPGYPKPVSPKSIYARAHKYGIEQLQVRPAISFFFASFLSTNSHIWRSLR